MTSVRVLVGAGQRRVGQRRLLTRQNVVPTTVGDPARCGPARTTKLTSVRVVRRKRRGDHSVNTTPSKKVKKFRSTPPNVVKEISTATTYLMLDDAKVKKSRLVFFDTRRNGQPPKSQLTKKSTCQKKVNSLKTPNLSFWLFYAQVDFFGG